MLVFAAARVDDLGGEVADDEKPVGKGMSNGGPVDPPADVVAGVVQTVEELDDGPAQRPDDPSSV